MTEPSSAHPALAPAPLPDKQPEASFDAGWLALRAAADQAARARTLTLAAAQWLNQRKQQRQQAGATMRALELIDLGCGSGANPVFLSAQLPGPQHWRLLDHDPALLQHAQTRCSRLNDADHQAIALTLQRCDLRTLCATELAAADLVCASALLDLVDSAWLERLADACARMQFALLITLSVDGRWQFSHEDGALAADDADDNLVRDAFNAHQRRDKGVGTALGPDAALYLSAQLKQRGVTVALAPSPWRLALDTPEGAALARALLEGWRDAACEQAPASAARIKAWHARRSACIGMPGWWLEVGHLDLFAIPSAVHA